MCRLNEAYFPLIYVAASEAGSDQCSGEEREM